MVRDIWDDYFGRGISARTAYPVPASESIDYEVGPWHFEPTDEERASTEAAAPDGLIKKKNIYGAGKLAAYAKAHGRVSFAGSDARVRLAGPDARRVINECYEALGYEHDIVLVCHAGTVAGIQDFREMISATIETIPPDESISVQFPRGSVLAVPQGFGGLEADTEPQGLWYQPRHFEWCYRLSQRLRWHLPVVAPNEKGPWLILPCGGQDGESPISNGNETK